MGTAVRLRARFAAGTGAFLLADLITGLAAYCVISAGALWVFSVSWIHLVQEYAAIGVAFGTPMQLELAWVGTFVTLPLAALAVFLAVRAYRLPRDLFRLARSATSLGVTPDSFRIPGSPFGKGRFPAKWP